MAGRPRARRGDRRRVILIALAVAALVWAGWFGVQARARARASAAGARGMQYHANLLAAQAQREYALANELDPVDWRWPYYIALLHIERGEAPAAADRLRAVVALKPDHALAWWRLGEAEFKQGRYEEADAAYARAEADPQVSGHARRGRARVSGRDAAPGPYVPPRDPLLDEVARISRNSLFLLKHAGSAAIAGDAAFREALTRRALEVDPRNPDVVYEVGSLLQRLHRPEEALPYFMRHVEMVEDDQQTLVQIGKCYSDLRRFAEAEAALRKALAVGDDAVGSYNLAFVMERQGQGAEAETLYRRAIDLDPGLASARTNLGGLLAERGRLAEAAVHLGEAMRLDPTSADAPTNLSAVLLQQGDAAGAERLARRAVEIRPSHPDAHANLGVALAQRGVYEEALRHLDEALRLDPRHAVARANRQAIAALK